MMMVQLEPEIADKLKAEAERRKVSLEELVNEWLKREWWEENLKKIRAESEHYRARHTELRAQYAEKVIAMRDGQVVEVGDEMLDVYRRVRERFGDEAVLITRVGNEPIETYTVKSPRLVTGKK